MCYNFISKRSACLGFSALCCLIIWWSFVSFPVHMLSVGVLRSTFTGHPLKAKMWWARIGCARTRSIQDMLSEVLNHVCQDSIQTSPMCSHSWNKRLTLEDQTLKKLQLSIYWVLSIGKEMRKLNWWWIHSTRFQAEEMKNKNMYHCMIITRGSLVREWDREREREIVPFVTLRKYHPCKELK